MPANSRWDLIRRLRVNLLGGNTHTEKKTQKFCLVSSKEGGANKYWENESYLSVLCFVDRASLYIIVNKANSVHNLFLVNLSISTSFGLLFIPSSGETTVFMRNLVLLTLCGWLPGMQCDFTLHTRQSSTQGDSTLYTRQLSTQGDSTLYSRQLSTQGDSTLHTRQSSTQNNKYQVSHKLSCFSCLWAHSCPKHVEIDKYTKNKLCTKLTLFTRILECVVNVMQDSITTLES